MREIFGTIPTRVFLIPRPFPETPLSEQLLGGWLAYLQHRDCLFLLQGGVVLALALIAAHLRWPGRLTRGLALATAAALTFLLSPRLSEGWDEFFLNLRHSYWLAQGRGFSLNGTARVEATTDFLPFFLAGCLGKIGFPLIDSAIVIGLSGTLLCILAAYAIGRRATNSETAGVLFALLTALFPCLLYVGSTGFMAPLFTGLIFWCIHDLFFARARHETRGLVLAAFLPWFRFEGVLLTALFWAARYGWEASGSARIPKLPTGARAYRNAVLLLSPFLLLTLWRGFTFGYPIPIPVLFKGGANQSVFWIMGARYAVTTFTRAKCHWALAFALLLAWRIRKSAAFRAARPLLGALVLLALFELPYHWGGGDWFPATWARYELPLVLLIHFSFWTFLYLWFLERLGPKASVVATVAALAILTPIWFSWTQLPGHLSLKNVSTFHKMLVNLGRPQNGWDRVDRLAAFGKFMARTLPPGATIASSELATIHFFSGTEVLDLMGLANPEVLRAPLQPFNSLNPINRRRDPATIDRHHPGVLAFYEMAAGLAPNRPVATESDRIRALQETNLGAYNIDEMYYHAGNPETFPSRGYEHVAVFFSDFLFDYWIRRDLLATHEKRLFELGALPQPPLSLPFHLSETIQEAFP